jgi:hypothetical protein
MEPIQETKDVATSSVPDDVSVMTYRELQNKCKELGLSSRGKTEELRKRIDAHFRIDVSDDIQIDKSADSDESRSASEGENQTLEDVFASIEASAKSSQKRSRSNPTPVQKVVNAPPPTYPEHNKSLLSSVRSSMSSFRKLISPRPKPEIIELLDDSDDEDNTNTAAIPTSIIASPSAMSTISSVANPTPEVGHGYQQEGMLGPIGEETSGQIKVEESNDSEG